MKIHSRTQGSSSLIPHAVGPGVEDSDAAHASTVVYRADDGQNAFFSQGEVPPCVLLYKDIFSRFVPFRPFQQDDDEVFTHPGQHLTYVLVADLHHEALTVLYQIIAGGISGCIFSSARVALLSQPGFPAWDTGRS